MTDALERLKRRQRPTVPVRDASLTPTPLPTPPTADISASKHLEQQIPTNVDTSTPGYPEQKIPTNPAIYDIPDFKQLASPESQTTESVDTETPRNLDILNSVSLPASTPKQNSEPEAVLQTKQSTLRLEQGVSDRLQSFTRTEGLCREVLIEAMFEYCEAHPEAMQAVLEEAKTKNEFRQQVANMKRAQSMMQRFGNTG